MGRAIKHPVPDRVKLSFVILGTLTLSLNPVWHGILCSCTHMTTVGVKGLKWWLWNQDFKLWTNYLIRVEMKNHNPHSTSGQHSTNSHCCRRDVVIVMTMWCSDQSMVVFWTNDASTDASDGIVLNSIVSSAVGSSEHIVTASLTSSLSRSFSMQVSREFT